MSNQTWESTVSRWLPGVAGLLLAFGSVWWATHDTPANRAAIEMKRQETYKTEAELGIKREETTQLRLRLKNQDRSNPATLQTVSTSSVPCINPDHTGSRRLAPIIAEPGRCLVREHSTTNFWVEFKSIPRNVEGVLAYDHIVLREGGDGKMYPFSMGRCYGDLADDKCMSFLESKLGVPLSITNRGSIRIEF